MKRMFLLIVSLVLVGACTPAQADVRSEALDKQSAELYQQVFSPFCAGRSLNDCPSSKAQELKAQMRAKLEAGVPPQTILEDVFRQFGEQYRTVPAYQGFGKLVWWVPVAFLVFGLFVALIVVLSRRSSRCRPSSQGGVPQSSTALSDEIRAQIDKELSSFD
jgi:cytochrome c-type biogenesis protein CcmH/NrfF